MKKLIFLFILFFAIPLHAQKAFWISTHSLIKPSNQSGAGTQDSVFVSSTTNNFNGVRVFRSTVNQDTINSKWVYVDGINADMTFEFGMINIAKRDSVTINFEAFRGIGTPDSSGISRHSIISALSSVNDTTLTYHLSDSSWISNRVFSKFRFSIYELSAQQNDYILNLNVFSPSGNQPTIRIN